MGKYDHFLEETINLGKSYRSYRKAAKKKRAPAKAFRLDVLKKEKAARDAANIALGVKYYPWPDIWEDV